MPLDHILIYIPTDKLEGMVNFLTTSLAHMGFKEYVRPIPTVVGLGEKKAWFWINAMGDEKDLDVKTFEKVLYKQHIAFAAENSEQVDKFYEAAIKAGGTCNGPPGPRANYHPKYYGAFVRDPVCGINFEVVTHEGK